MASAAAFQEHFYYKLFLQRLISAKESRGKLESLQIELKFLEVTDKVTELAGLVQLELQKLSHLQDGSDDEKGPKHENGVNGWGVEGEEIVPSSRIGASSGPPEQDVLQTQKLKLLQLKNLLANEAFIDVDNGGVDQASQKPVSLAIKKKLLFNSSGLTKESGSRKKDEISEQELILEKDRAEQEKLSEILAEKAKALMENSKAISNKLESDSSKLDTLEGKLFDNLDRTKKERETMKKISSSSWMTTIMIWGGLLLGLLIFLWAFLYIRMVSPTRIHKVVYKTETVLASSSTVSTTTATSSTHASSVSSSRDYEHDHDHDHYDSDDL